MLLDETSTMRLHGPAREVYLSLQRTEETLVSGAERPAPASARTASPVAKCSDAPIARALATRPPLILADRPTGNLDSHNSAKVIGFCSALTPPAVPCWLLRGVAAPPAA